MILPIVLGASVIGAIVGIGMKVSSSLREGRYVPFGPFLAGGGLVMMFAGPERVMGWLGWADPMGTPRCRSSGRPRPLQHRPDRRHRQRQEHGRGHAGASSAPC